MIIINMLTFAQGKYSIKIKRKLQKSGDKEGFHVLIVKKK